MAAETYKYPNLERARRFKGLTVEEMMNKIDRSRDTYYTWQSKGQISAIDLIKLNKLLGVSVDCILGLKELQTVSS